MGLGLTQANENEGAQDNREGLEALDGNAQAAHRVSAP